MTKISVLLGGNETYSREQMKLVIEFETELANITTSAENRRDEETLYKLMSITDLQMLSPFLKWHAFFNDAFRKINKKVDEKDNVVVYASEYLQKLNDVVEKYMKTEQGNK